MKYKDVKHIMVRVYFDLYELALLMNEIKRPLYPRHRIFFLNL